MAKQSITEKLHQLGTRWERKGNIKKALDYYQSAIEQDPNHFASYVCVANILLEQGNLDDAIYLYKLAIEKNPENAEVYNNLGTAYAMQHKYGNALREYKKSLRIKPDFRDALENIASTYASAGKGSYAIKHLKRAVILYPNNGNLLAMLYQQKRQAADWQGLGTLKRRLNKVTEKDIKARVRPGEDPFINVIFTDDPKINLEVAKLWGKNNYSDFGKENKFTYQRGKGKKIRIGYLSSHFREHPTGHLIASLFKYRNNKKFQTFVYSINPNDKSDYYKTVKQTADVFRDIYSLDHLSAAKIINKDKINILVDLDGYTDSNRLQIFALRPAPIQLTYLGFPGTTGTAFMDYMITDRQVTPKSQEKNYSEKLIFLPGCYQVNNDSQAISNYKYRKSQFGIPENAFVFCSFNGTYKIDPYIFDIWMHLLKAVPTSILWLYQTNSQAVRNLKKEAEKRGIEQHRIIFAKRLPRDRHLKRLSLADLCLDTFICNGHTTTSDAIWAGVPVIIMTGKHFASRVSTSILLAAGLPELITKSPQEYEELAVELAKNPKKLKGLREKLAENKKTAPYFNTRTFTKNLEKAYTGIWENYLLGNQPTNIDITDD